MDTEAQQITEMQMPLPEDPGEAQYQMTDEMMA